MFFQDKIQRFSAGCACVEGFCWPFAAAPSAQKIPPKSSEPDRSYVFRCSARSSDSEDVEDTATSSCSSSSSADSADSTVASEATGATAAAATAASAEDEGDSQQPRSQPAPVFSFGQRACVAPDLAGSFEQWEVVETLLALGQFC